MRRFLWMVACVFAAGAWQSSAAAVAFACEVAGRAIGVVADNEYRAMCAAVQSCDMGLRAEFFSKDDSVIARVGCGQRREFSRLFPVEMSAVDDHLPS